MSNQKPLKHSPPIRFEELNRVASSALPRDREQSHRLHEPAHLIGTIDLMTGQNIIDVTGSPSLVDVNLIIHFESEKTKVEFKQMPLNQHYQHAFGEPVDDIDRGC
jgi:hypothetical protein